ncbi:hypothetical protein [Mycolicibacillus koreensis]|uniref:Uncharacterized protein n=1 Tax=Mycolicibacillus koreensis TaxID=1069220 RepID=A0A7I7SBY6_9MYCO|nr:hypothetical protein [Mycolicibacillus koreensis]OSC32795.1 hypothetical protein B8W67_13660 [Mycolicibacillus koreensis]BBY54010.1 hypothetical protein MKOR_12610 [Mycolicibacillus koreensis]
MVSSTNRTDRLAKALKDARPDFTLHNARGFARAVIDAPHQVFAAKPLSYLPAPADGVSTSGAGPAPAAVPVTSSGSAASSSSGASTAADAQPGYLVRDADGKWLGMVLAGELVVRYGTGSVAALSDVAAEEGSGGVTFVNPLGSGPAPPTASCS